MKWKAFALLILTAFCTPANAQQSIRLLTGWQYLKMDVGGIWEVVRPVEKDKPEMVPLWQNIRLPHCVNAEDAVDPDVNYYQGPAWYRTTLAIRNPYAKGRTLLHFEGAGQKTEVYIYTTKVGSHTGGYDEWTVDITEAIAAFEKTNVYQKQFGGNIPLSIRTDNSRDLQMIPSDMSDFTIYGGLYRYVNLVYQPALSIDKIFISPSLTPDFSEGQLSVKGRFYNPANAASATVNLKLVDPAGKVIQEMNKLMNSLDGNLSIADFSVKKPLLWSPDHPKLYSIITTLKQEGVSTTSTEHFAFRNFEFQQKGPFFLNGKRLLLRGTQRHEDAAGVGAALTEDMMRQEMILIRNMGANFIRLGHYQNSSIILNLCDSLGIMAWEEIPWCRGGLGGEIYKEQARRMLTNMIEQHYNHPAVIIWGMGNENDWPGDFETFDKEQIRAFMKELNDLSHRLDTSRKTAIRRCDFCKDLVDVYSPSIWAGWYKGFYTDYRQLEEEGFRQTDRFLHAEWGGDSHAGRHSEMPDSLLQTIQPPGDTAQIAKAARASKDNNWNENYICNLFDWHLKEQENMPWLTGTAQWVFRDFSTPLRPDNPVPYVNQKGLVERDLAIKEGYYVFQSYWSAQPMVHVYGHSWPVRWGPAGEEKMIKVYSNCSEAELFVNGKSYGIKTRNSTDFPAAGLRWNVALQKGTYELKVIAKKGRVNVEDTLHFIYETRKWGKPAKMILQKIHEKEDVAVVEAKLLDANGVQCLDAVDWIRFGLAGDGKLIDNQGTSTGSRLVQLCNGRAIIKVQLNSGKSMISTKITGVPTAFLAL